MAPIPPNFDAETAGIIANLRRSTIDIAEIQIPRLRDCKGPIANQQRYAVELRESLDDFESKVETLDGIAEDMTARRDRESLKAIAEEFKVGYTKMRKDMRLALLQSKKNIDLETKNNREALFKGSVSGVEKKDVNEKATDDALMDASNNVTDALRRTIDTMQRELERSVLSQQMLDHSTSTLQITSNQHSTLSHLVNSSGQLITALEKADWLDRLIIGAALTFFVLVVLFILKQRILDRGIRLAFWWVKWMPGLGMSGGGKSLADLEKGLEEELRNAASKVAAEGKVKASEVVRVATSLVGSVAAVAAGSSSSILSPVSPTSSLSSVVMDTPTPQVIESMSEPVIPATDPSQTEIDGPDTESTLDITLSPESPHSSSESDTTPFYGSPDTVSTSSIVPAEDSPLSISASVTPSTEPSASLIASEQRVRIHEEL